MEESVYSREGAKKSEKAREYGSEGRQRGNGGIKIYGWHSTTRRWSKKKSTNSRVGRKVRGKSMERIMVCMEKRIDGWEISEIEK